MKLEENLHTFILNELKSMGVRLPKSKRRITICKKSQSSYSESNPDQIFGVSLASQEWITVDCHGTPVPKFLALVTEYLLQHKECEGLFRKTGSISRQRELRKFLENGGNLGNTAPHDVTALLKQWFRELPESVIPRSLHDIFLSCYEVKENQTAACLLACLLLPPEHLYTLQHTINFLSNIAKNSSQNKMNSLNLAVIMAPNLLPPSKPTNEKARSIVECQAGLICLLIENEDKVGQLPPDIAEKLGSVGIVVSEERDCNSSEDGLEKSDELLDGPTKPKKKRCSGTVQELVSGIRKFVSHKRTPLQPLIVSSNVYNPMKHKEQDANNSPMCNSPSKRKTDSATPINKKTCHGITPGFKLYSTPDTNEVLKLTPILPSAMISLSDIDWDSPSEVKYGPSPMVKTYRKSLRIIKNKQRKRDISTRLKDRASLYIKDNGMANIITTKADIHKSVTPKAGNNYSPHTTHLTKKVAVLSLLSPSQRKVLADNKNTLDQTIQLDKNHESIDKPKGNNVSAGDEIKAKRMDLSELCTTNVFRERQSSRRCPKRDILEEKQADEALSERRYGREKMYKGHNTKLNTDNGGLVRKVGSVRTRKGSSESNLKKHMSASSIAKKENSVKQRPERKLSSQSVKENKNSTSVKTSSKTKLERKVSSRSTKSNKGTVGKNDERETKLIKKMSSKSPPEKRTIISCNDSKPKLEKMLSSHLTKADTTPVTVSPEKNFRRNIKSSLRRGRPNTIKSGLPPSMYVKHCSDSAVGRNLPNNDSPQTPVKRITRSESALHNNVFQQEPALCNMPSPRFNKSSIASNDSLIKTNSNNNSVEEVPSIGNKISICSTPLENSCIRKPLFIEHVSSNLSSSDSGKGLDDTIEPKYSFSSKSYDSIKPHQLKNTEPRNLSGHPLPENNVALLDSCLQQDQCEEKRQCKKKNTELEDKEVNSNNSYADNSESMKAFRKDITLDLMVTPKESCSTTENLSKSREDPHWTSALEYFSKCENENENDFTKRESIVKLRLRNAGKVKANIQHYNSIGGNTSFCTPEVSRINQLHTPASLSVPNAFGRKSVEAQLLGEKLSSSKTNNNKSLRLTPSASKSETCSNTNSEFKMPTPLRKTRKIQSNNNESMHLRCNEEVSPDAF